MAKNNLPYYVKVNTKEFFLKDGQPAIKARAEMERLFSNGAKTIRVTVFGHQVKIDAVPAQQGQGWDTLKDVSLNELYFRLKKIGEAETSIKSEVNRKTYITIGEAERHTRWTATVDRRKGLDL